MKLTILKSISITVAAILLGVMVIAIVKWVGLRHEAEVTNLCIVHLQEIDAGKEQWALENNKDTNAVPTWKDLNSYLANALYGDGEKEELYCPAGGVYTIGRIGVFSTCSIPEHKYFPGELDVGVETENGSNLVGATVELLDASGYKAISQTDRNGGAYIKTWTNAVLFVIVSKPGYVTVSNTFEAIWNSPAPLQLKRIESTNGAP